MAKKKTTRNSYKRNTTLHRSPIYTMHARAAKKRNDSMHKAGAVVLLIVAVCASVWLVVAGAGKVNRWLFADNDQFTIRTLDISSSGRLSKSHIREFGNVSIGQNLFAVDISEVQHNLEDGPLVKSAEIMRKLPDTLVIRVNERIPLARISHGNSKFYFSVDEDGHVLGLAGSQYSDMPIIQGHSDKGLTPGDVLHDGAAIDALKVIEICDTSPISQVIHIDTIDVSHPDYLGVFLEGNVKVLLPRNTSRNKIEDLVVILRESRGRKSFFDLTVDRNIPAT